MRALLVASVAVLSACSPNDDQVAQQCGVSTAEWERTKSAVNAMRPYAGVELGKCTVMKDHSGVGVIPPEVKRRADLMVGYERVLNGVADRCGVPRDVWRVVSADQVQLVPDGVSSGKVSCLLSGFRTAKLPVEVQIFGSGKHQ